MAAGLPEGLERGAGAGGVGEGRAAADGHPGDGDAAEGVPGAGVVPRIRAMSRTDVDAVAEIERGAFSQPWRPETFGTLLENPTAEMWVAEDREGGVVGYFVLWCIQEQGELANIAVTPGHRQQGLGSRLLDRAVERARERGVERLYLEVRISNTVAAEMYERRGFREVGRRRNYYEKPREDARVLMKKLDPDSSEETP